MEKNEGKSDDVNRRHPWGGVNLHDAETSSAIKGLNFRVCMFYYNPITFSLGHPVQHNCTILIFFSELIFANIFLSIFKLDGCLHFFCLV